MTEADIRKLLDDAEQFALSRQVRAYTVAEFLALEIPPREHVLAPWLPTKGLAMIYSKRGVGKTHVALGISYAVATGSSFLRWQAPKPRQVLHIDGEMPGSALLERIASQVSGTEQEPPDPHYLKIIAADLEDHGIPDLTTEEGQAAISKHLDGIELVVVDNLSTLVRSGKENEAESWQPIQEWALGLRRKGISVLFVHHAGKGGAQRGTSKREDVLDSVIALKHPSDYSAPDGARFEVHLEKARGVFGEDAKPFEAHLEVRDGVAVWATRDIEDAETERVATLLRDGFSVRDAAEELGMSKSAVQRRKQKAMTLGLLDG